MCACPKSRQMPISGRSSTSSTKWTSEPARDSSFGITSTATRTPERLSQTLQCLEAAPRAVAAVVGRRGLLGARKPDVRHEDAKWHAPRDLQRALGLRHRPSPRVGIRARQRQRRTPAAAREALADRRMDAVQFEAGFRKPLLEVGHGRRIVIVEMRPRGEQLDAIETVRPDLEQMLSRQPIVVVEVRRDPERSLARHLNHSL